MALADMLCWWWPSGERESNAPTRLRVSFASPHLPRLKSPAPR